MVKKINLLVFVTLVTAFSGFSQVTQLTARPLVSNRAEVVKAFGEGVKEVQNRFRYENKDETVWITYSKDACYDSGNSNVKVPENSVVEVKIVPKVRVSVYESISSERSIDRYVISDDRVLYYSTKSGVVAFGSKFEGIETTDVIFLTIPANRLSDCLALNFDNDSGLAQLERFGVSKVIVGDFPFPPIQVGRFFVEDSRSSKEELFAEFISKLRERQKSIGYVVLSQKPDANPRSIETRRIEIVERLMKEGVPCSRLAVVDGSKGGMGGTSFYIVHRGFIDEQKVKPVCDEESGSGMPF